MTMFNFPSAEFPAFPSISIDVPDHWRPAHAPGVLIAAAESDAGGRFASNITASATRHSKDYDLAGSLADLRAAIAALPDAKIEEPFTTRIGDREFIGCNAAFRDPGAGTLVQVHLFTAIERGAAADVLHFVGTCSADKAPTAYAELQATLGTVRIAVNE